MSASDISILVIFCVIVAAFALAVFNRSREEKKKTEEILRKTWGKIPERTYPEESLRTMRAFSDAERTKLQEKEKRTVHVDDITWSDLSMDEVFQRVNGTLSSPGEDVLYSWLRRPLISGKELTKRQELIHFFESKSDARDDIRKVLARLGRGKRSYYSDAEKALWARPVGRLKYIIFCLITIACLAFLFIQPVAAVIALVIDFIVNIAVETQGKRKIESGLSGFGAILRMFKAGQELEKISETIKSDDARELSELSSKAKKSIEGLSAVKGAAVLGGNADLGAGSAIFTYLNLFFHFDLIIYDRIASAIQENGEAVYDLADYIGSIDAACAVASFRQSAPYWCAPDLYVMTDSEDQSVKAGVKVTGLYHLLLEHPVANDFEAFGGNLLTGANASGKSTFLKSLAIAAVLAQSLATVPAGSYRAPFFKVETSMAIRDSLLKGESYFVVEIKSLKRILDDVSEINPPVLGIVDEVLKGTNTIERIAASAQILAEMAKGRGLVVAATHDIELTEILADLYENWHFSGEVRDGDVRFSYHIEKGATKERNAIALLKVLGYDPGLADRAERSAEHFEKTGVWKR